MKLETHALWEWDHQNCFSREGLKFFKPHLEVQIAYSRFLLS